MSSELLEAALKNIQTREGRDADIDLLVLDVFRTGNEPNDSGARNAPAEPVANTTSKRRAALSTGELTPERVKADLAPITGAEPWQLSAVEAEQLRSLATTDPNLYREIVSERYEKAERAIAEQVAPELAPLVGSEPWQISELGRAHLQEHALNNPASYRAILGELQERRARFA